MSGFGLFATAIFFSLLGYGFCFISLQAQKMERKDEQSPGEPSSPPAVK